MEFVLILLLIILNGLLSMIEIAAVSLKKTRLHQLKTEGDRRAIIISDLLEDPNKFFSTIQVGITLIGVFNGALGGIILSEPVAKLLRGIGLNTFFSENIAFLIVVLLITYLSIVIGELVPKRIGLEFSEKVALWTAFPMKTLSQIFGPAARILSSSTAFILRFLPLNSKKENGITSQEIKMMIREGAQSGVFEKAERTIVEKTLSLSEIKVNALMTAKNKIVWIEKNASVDEIKNIVIKNPYSYFPVCNKEVDNLTQGLIQCLLLDKLLFVLSNLDIHLYSFIDFSRIFELFKCYQSV
jgi:putative hemolysin